VRDLKKEPAVRAMLRAGGASEDAKLTVCQADLQQDAGRREAVEGCDYVLHVASPTLTSLPKNDDEMVVPARDGVLRVLRAAREAGVKRVVLTSAFGAVGMGHPEKSGYVDVRDVADLHLRAMTDPAAAGERFLAISGHSLWVREIAAILRDRLGDRASKVPTRELPVWTARALARVNPGLRLLRPQLGRNFDATSEKARRVLGWSPRPIEDTIADTAESLLALKGATV
jgi:nucleoside-diphosphate-sugar epimerase